MQQPFYSDVPVHPFMIIIVIISVLYTYNFYLFIYFLFILFLVCHDSMYCMLMLFNVIVLLFLNNSKINNNINSNTINYKHRQ